MKFSFVLPQVSRDKLQPFNVHLGMDWVSGCTYRWYGVVCESVVDRFYANAKHTVLDPSVDRAPLNEPV